MFALTDAPRLDRECADEPKLRQAPAPGRGHRDASGLETRRSGQEDLPPYDHRGAILVASVWLVFYVIACIQYFMPHGD